MVVPTNVIPLFRKSLDRLSDKIRQLEGNKDIIRNRLKIKASINNTKIFKNIKEEYGSFKNYLLTFTDNKIYYEINMTSSELSNTTLLSNLLSNT